MRLIEVYVLIIVSIIDISARALPEPSTQKHNAEIVTFVYTHDYTRILFET